MSPSRRQATAAGAAGLGLVLAIAGCSSDQGGPGPTQTVETFLHAIGSKDPDAACAQVSTGGKPLGGTALEQCRVGLQKVLADVQDPGDLEKLKAARVTGATVDRDKATIVAAQIVDVPDGYQNDIDLLRLDGRWYIDSKSDQTR